MPAWLILRALLVVLVAQMVGASGAAAHHGYEWLDPQFFTLNGAVEDVYFGFPHGFMVVYSDDGEEWLVELSDPPGNELAGFMADTARPGDEVRVIGHRALDPRERTMRGDKVVVHGVTYEVFPAATFLPIVYATGFKAWLLALQNWSVASALRSASFAYPMVNALHLLGIAMLVGAILSLDLGLLGAFGRLKIGELARVLVPVSATGLVVAVVAGFLLFSVKPLDYWDNPAFLTKISLVALGTINAVALRSTGAWRQAVAGGPIRPWLMAAATVSALVWVAALLAGRMIAFIH